MAASGMSQIVATIGNGTNITSGFEQWATPYKTYWEDGQDQLLYTAGDLALAGLGAGNITALAFHVGSNPDSAVLHQFTISVQQICTSAAVRFYTRYTAPHSPITATTMKY